jgi:hypothetical protein
MFTAARGPHCAREGAVIARREGSPMRRQPMERQVPRANDIATRLVDVGVPVDRLP